MKLRPQWLCQLIARFDYGLVLPILAKLHPALAKWPLRLRGLINWAFDLEWRTITLRHGYIRAATLQAMRDIAKLNGAGSPRWWTLRRFVCASREECDALRLQSTDFDRMKWKAQGLNKVVEATRNGQGVVLLTGHFDSLYMGLMVLAKQGVVVNLMSSKIMEDERVPTQIRNLFASKIGAMDQQFAPGRVLHFEDGMKPFIDGLKRGEVLVIACDAPSVTPGRASAVDFLGRRFLMAPGPEFFATKTQALVSFYSCVQQDDLSFEIECSALHSLADGGLQKAFDCLDMKIRKAPWRWWAADLYRTFPEAATHEHTSHG